MVDDFDGRRTSKAADRRYENHNVTALFDETNTWYFTIHARLLFAREIHFRMATIARNMKRFKTEQTVATLSITDDWLNSRIAISKSKPKIIN